MRDLSRRIDNIEKQMAGLDNADRKRILLIEGVPEPDDLTPDENLDDIALDIIAKVAPNLASTDIDLVY